MRQIKHTPQEDDDNSSAEVIITNHCVTDNIEVAIKTKMRATVKVYPRTQSSAIWTIYDILTILEAF